MKKTEGFLVKLSDADLKLLDRKRGSFSRGVYLIELMKRNDLVTVEDEEVEIKAEPVTVPNLSEREKRALSLNMTLDDMDKMDEQRKRREWADEQSRLPRSQRKAYVSESDNWGA